jgi:hypothetical protein
MYSISWMYGVETHPNNESIWTCRRTTLTRPRQTLQMGPAHDAAREAQVTGLL